MAEVYADHVRTLVDAMPFDRAMFGVFAELVRDAGQGAVGDLGCGPGRMTAYLASLGVDAFGVDLSPAMIEIARRTYPELRFEVGSMDALDVPDGSLGGVVAYYSLIHTPPEHVPAFLAEFRRVLAPGGHLLLGFFAEDRSGFDVEPFDHKVSLAYRWSPDHLAELLRQAGFAMNANLVREPAANERFQQAYLLAAKPAASSG
ncbi:class I SAM-dependent methyltransferase [Sphaerisporangium siamense]|uniref:SAM-dependent methyltransferase n=1 Tax=Sphaerisporangium siamense TaxID=795645 RepID=A0A7W7D3Q7_9ACTN|nr:class I SAM-dependent methyltransferase [Sphaerisporangium siamense]MBB4699765.1 SAM-dependent methyltransferase [Sphaerisporangium siamense]